MSRNFGKNFNKSMHFKNSYSKIDKKGKPENSRGGTAFNTTYNNKTYV